MACIRIYGECPGILTVPDIFTVTDANGREWRFDYHHYLGPSVLKANGDPRERQPGIKSSFWPAFSAWAKNRKAE